MERQIEGQRGLELRISNAQFSKLIKMGREQGKTPQRVGQALFDEAYEAACLGKGKAAAEPAGDQQENNELRGAYDAAVFALRDEQRKNAQARLAIEEWQGKAEKAADERDEWKARHDLAVEKLCQAEKDLDQARKTIAGKDQMLLDQAKEIREANATIEQLRQRIEEETGTLPTALIDQAAIDAASVRPGPIVFVSNPPPEPAIERLGPIVPVKAIKGMKAAGNTAAEIARDLGLDLATVRQVLG